MLYKSIHMKYPVQCLPEAGRVLMASHGGNEHVLDEGVVMVAQL